MTIENIQEAINIQIDINKFLEQYNIKDLVGDYGELIIQNTIGGERQKAVNQGFDIMHEKYHRIEVKTRKYKRDKDGNVKKENRAVGFKGKENNFDWLAHLILDEEFNVLSACMAKYDEVWPEIQRLSNKVSYKTSSELPSSFDITNEAIAAQNKLNN
ncbi:MAG: hypothetical protein KAI79_09870 [Bacteroidales bacterium]|nr:hypothetical protein [Bacteroidales bacterium]